MLYVIAIWLLPYSPSSGSSFGASPKVPLVASFSVRPNAAPLSVDILATGSFAVRFLSHHVTTTFPPSAAFHFNMYEQSRLSHIWRPNSVKKLYAIRC